jgi:hypothetical protein
LGVNGAAFTDYYENKIVDDLFRSTAYTPPATAYLGLMTTACSDSAAGTEVSGGSYARVAVSKADASWKGTHGSATGVSSGTSGTISNAAAVTFPAPTASWGSVTHWGVWDAATAGNLLVCDDLTIAKTINSGDAAPSFAIDQLTIQVDN